MGRRRTIWISCLIQAIGALLQGTSFSLGQFIVARIVLGLGTGGIIATTSVWQSELSKPESRGEHVSAFGIFCGSGLALALWIEFGMSYVKNSSSWRFPLMVPIIFSTIVMIFIFTLPESPRWLIKVGRIDEARHIISLTYDQIETSERVNKEVRDIQLSLELAGSTSLISLFKMAPQRTLHRVCLAIGTQIFLQMSGINAITYYASSLYEE